MKLLLSNQVNGIDIGHPFVSLGAMRNVIRAVIANAPRPEWLVSSERVPRWKVKHYEQRDLAQL